MRFAPGLALIFLLATVAGCTESAAVRDTPASAAPAPAPAEAVDHREYFDKAVRAMEKMGRVEKADFERGLIQGITHSGVAMEIEVVYHEGRAPELNVQAELPEGMAGLGTISEPDRYMAIFHELGERR
jgi:hypothetical protein